MSSDRFFCQINVNMKAFHAWKWKSFLATNWLQIPSCGRSPALPKSLIQHRWVLTDLISNRSVSSSMMNVISRVYEERTGSSVERRDRCSSTCRRREDLAITATEAPAPEDIDALRGARAELDRGPEEHGEAPADEMLWCVMRSLSMLKNTLSGVRLGRKSPAVALQSKQLLNR